MRTPPSTPSNPGFSLERDAKGRIIRRVCNLGKTPEIRRYAYDSAGRLARVTDESGALCESYQYDGEDRRLADINPQRFRGERRYAYAAGNRLSQAGRAQYRHDKAGFRSLKIDGEAVTRYQYEPSGLLLAVALPGGRRIDYAYDSSGMRREKRVDGRLVEAYRWLDPLRLLEFFDGSQWWRLVYDFEQGRGRAPLGVTNGRDSYLLLTDHLGTPLALANPDGGVVQAMQYDSFGNLLAVAGDVVRLPLGFAGGLFDADTGLTRFVWRDYDADTGRFTALDPLGAKGGDNDWYGYCVDDPVNRVDAWGLFSFEERPLDGPSGSQISIFSVLLKKANLEGKHVQGFYDDGSGDNVGLFPDGLRRDEKHPRSHYEPKSSHYPDDVAREAERILRHEGIGDYETVGNNCQDFEDKMTQKMYDIGRYFRGSVLDPR